jgi:hypothetical protein
MHRNRRQRGPRRLQRYEPQQRYPTLAEHRASRASRASHANRESAASRTSRERGERNASRDDEARWPPAAQSERPDRRRFLQGSAVLLGGGVLTACGRPFGHLNENNNNQQLDGGMELPDYHRIRIPEVDDRAVHLVDDGYARYFVVALTYTEDCALFAVDARPRLGTRLDAVIGERTYDELDTADEPTLAALRESLRQALDEAYNEDTGDVGSRWFTAVELTFIRLDPPTGNLGGVPPRKPSYP